MGGPHAGDRGAAVLDGAIMGTRTSVGLGGRGQQGPHLWGMSSTLTRPQTPTTKVSTSHSLMPRAMRKWPPSPHAVPQELAAVCGGDVGCGSALTGPAKDPHNPKLGLRWWHLSPPAWATANS